MKIFQIAFIVLFCLAAQWSFGQAALDGNDVILPFGGKIKTSGMDANTILKTGWDSALGGDNVAIYVPGNNQAEIPRLTIAENGHLFVNYGFDMKTQGMDNNNLLTTGWDSNIGDYVSLWVPGNGPIQEKPGLTLLETGNLGVGTTSPKAALHLNGSSGLLLTDPASGDARMSLKSNHNVSSLNPGATTVAARITNRYFGHLVFDIEANDSQDAFAIRTDANMDGEVDRISLVAKPSGRIGIGTTTPSNWLDVRGNIGIFNPNSDAVLNLYTTRPDLTQGIWTGTAGSGNQGWTLFGRNTNSSSSTKGDLLFSYWNDETWRTAMVLENETGSVGIATANIPTGYKLAVNGKVICEELRVELDQNWPDYVFEEDYDLMPLSEVEKSIQENGHLPGMPSAAEVEAEGGVDVGEMQRLMLEKMEEMTLHMIELKKENKALQQENRQLNSRLEALENQE
jgi:hypothetical protein